MKTVLSVFLAITLLMLMSVSAWAEDAVPASRTIDITKLTCKEVMAGDDADRSATNAFFHGYLAGRKNMTTIDLDAMSDLSDKVKDFCLSNPNNTVLEAFTKSAK